MKHEKNDFAEVFKKISLDTDLKIILLNYQSNYVGRSKRSLEYQNFLLERSLCLSFPYNCFDDPTKLLSDLYLVKFLDASTKSFFSCSNVKLPLLIIKETIRQFLISQRFNKSTSGDA